MKQKAVSALSVGVNRVSDAWADEPQTVRGEKCLIQVFITSWANSLRHQQTHVLLKCLFFSTFLFFTSHILMDKNFTVTAEPDSYQQSNTFPKASDKQRRAAYLPRHTSCSVWWARCRDDRCQRAKVKPEVKTTQRFSTQAAEKVGGCNDAADTMRDGPQQLNHIFKQNREINEQSNIFCSSCV